MCSLCDGLVKAIDAYIAKADNDLENELKAEGYANPKKTVKRIKQIEDEVAEALIEETDYFTAKAKKSIDLETFAKDVWPGVQLNDTLSEKLSNIFTEQLSDFIPDFVGIYIKQTDRELTLNGISKRTTAWVESWSKDLGEIMKLNSHKEIEGILNKGLENGDSIATFTQNILDSGIRDEYYKARRVSVTEVLRAHSVAQHEAFEQSPAVTQKSWKHTGEYRNEPRQNHVDMDGQIADVSEPFELVGADGTTYYPMYPRDIILPPEESINCHCIEQPVVSEEILGLSLEERQRLQAEAIAKMDDEWEKEIDAQNKAKAGIED